MKMRKRQKGYSPGESIKEKRQCGYDIGRWKHTNILEYIVNTHGEAFSGL